MLSAIILQKLNLKFSIFNRKMKTNKEEEHCKRPHDSDFSNSI